jgi:hypothetical protein
LTGFLRGTRLKVGQGMTTMGQWIEVAHGTAAARPWLSLLIEAMELAARTDLPASACEGSVRSALILQLASPAPTCRIAAPRLSLRN